MLVNACPCKCEDGRWEEYADSEILCTPWGTPYGVKDYVICMDCNISFERCYSWNPEMVNQLYSKGQHNS